MGARRSRMPKKHRYALSQLRTCFICNAPVKRVRYGLPACSKHGGGRKRHKRPAW